jgi:formate dehydrogenase subunit delta
MSEMDDHAMMGNQERLIYMANQIARNLAAQGPDEAAAATAQHIRDFWDPRMKQMLKDNGACGLSPIAAAALDRLNAQA